MTNTPDVLTRATAEHAVGLMLALLRRIAEGDRFVRRRSEWEFSLEFMLGRSLDGSVQILDGLVEGDEVIVHSERDLSAGARVKVVGQLAGKSK